MKAVTKFHYLYNSLTEIDQFLIFYFLAELQNDVPIHIKGLVQHT
mgnify:CR=1 FL=1